MLVHFFATWCEPCRPELASLSQLAARGRREITVPEVSVLSISVAEPVQRLQRFFETNPVDFPVLIDRDRAAAKAWGVSMLPTTFVLDREGTVRLSVEGDLDWLRPGVLAQLKELEGGRPATN